MKYVNPTVDSSANLNDVDAIFTWNYLNKTIIVCRQKGIDNIMFV